MKSKRLCNWYMMVERVEETEIRKSEMDLLRTATLKVYIDNVF